MADGLFEEAGSKLQRKKSTKIGEKSLKFFRKTLGSKVHEYRLKNSDYNYLYVNDQTGKDADLSILSRSPVNVSSTSKETVEIFNDYPITKSISYRDFRKFILGVQKFNPDHISISSKSTDLNIHAHSNSKGFRASLRLARIESVSLEYVFRFSSIKPIKFLKSEDLYLQLGEDFPLRLVFKESGLALMLISYR